MNSNWYQTLLETLSPADLGYALFLLFFLFRGLIRGFSKEVAGLLVMLSVAAGGWTLYRPISRWLLEHTRIKEVEASDLIALILSVVVLYIGLRLVGWLLSKIIDFAFTDKIERPFGFIAGLVQGLAWISILVLAVAVSGHKYLQEKLIDDSRLGSLLARHVPAWWDKIDGALKVPETEEPPPAIDDLSPGAEKAQPEAL